MFKTNRGRILLSYLKYKAKARTRHGVHSPFVYDLIEKVLNNSHRYYCYSSIDRIREKMMNDLRKIKVTDLGTGSSGDHMIAAIARRTYREKKYGELLFRLADYFKPKVILELGTSLGISTSYLASANSKTKVITVEGCPETQKVASENFQEQGLTNVVCRTGEFSKVLPEILAVEKPDLVFFDGNHRKEPTLNYYRQCKAVASPNALFIFDDINWSVEMQEAWQEIKADPTVTVSVDLFYMGMVFFNSDLSKEDFILKY